MATETVLEIDAHMPNLEAVDALAARLQGDLVRPGSGSSVTFSRE